MNGTKESTFLSKDFEDTQLIGYRGLIFGYRIQGKQNIDFPCQIKKKKKTVHMSSHTDLRLLQLLYWHVKAGKMQFSLHTFWSVGSELYR